MLPVVKNSILVTNEDEKGVEERKE